jgi:UPF0042 nucleotide-binding protein
MPDRPHLVVITGMSGAGRSTAAKALEDLGFYVIDNLPARLIADVLDADGDIPWDRLAVVVDTRGGLSFSELEGVLATMDGREDPPTLLFLDAEDDVLVKRFNESRRPHPVERSTLAESIAVEREALEALRTRADVVVDTSGRSVHDLRATLQETFAGERPKRPMRVTVTSFGFKHGLPPAADLVLDVRFLPNPHWEPALRDLTGLDKPVRDYVFEADDAERFLAMMREMLEFLVPRYEAEGKAYLTIGVGCTGGHHRSVAIAEHLVTWLKGREVPATVSHRDVER